GSQARAQAQEEHLPASVAAESLHRSIVHEPDGTTECLPEVESDPAKAQVVRFGDRMIVQDGTRVADRHYVELPSLGKFVDSIDHLLRRHRGPGGDLPWLLRAGSQNPDVRAADIDREYLHS